MKTVTSKLSDFYHGDNAILVGNGINLLNGGIKWGDLLQKLFFEFKIKSITDRDPKEISYPLIFEEILFNIKGESFDKDLKKLKIKIYDILNEFESNDFHHRILGLNAINIITTNYDYSLEKCLNKEYAGVVSPGKHGRYKYSIDRRTKLNGKIFWHIHGELNNGFKGTTRYKQESILIGNEHYADYLAKIHLLLKSPDRNGGLVKVFKERDDIWVKLFFSHNIHIIGFNIDYTEIHLWWLLNFRARLIRKGLSISNKIYFYYPSFDENKYKYKNSLLKALEVNPIPISFTAHRN